MSLKYLPVIAFLFLALPACRRDAAGEESMTQSGSSPNSSDLVCAVDSEVGKICGPRNEVILTLRRLAKAGIDKAQEQKNLVQWNVNAAKAMCWTRNGAAILVVGLSTAQASAALTMSSIYAKIAGAAVPAAILDAASYAAMAPLLPGTWYTGNLAMDGNEQIVCKGTAVGE